MKFLCVPCDKPMRLAETRPPDRGSIALLYACDDCGYEMAMLTNPYETQVVGSLGVDIGPDPAAAAAGQAAQPAASKCPFSGMVQQMTEAAQEPEGMRWSTSARARLETIPQFVRPMAKTGIEKFAREQGRDEIDDALLDQAKHFFGM